MSDLHYEVGDWLLFVSGNIRRVAQVEPDLQTDWVLHERHAASKAILKRPLWTDKDKIMAALSHDDPRVREMLVGIVKRRLAGDRSIGSS